MRIVILLLTVLLLGSCHRNAGELITNAEDYNSFLKTNTSKPSSKYFDLWNSKIRADSMQLLSFGIVAGEYNRYFSATGEIEYLKKAEKALERAVAIAAIGKAGYLRALARNYISQHRFKDALHLAEAARKKGSGVSSSWQLLFDVHMELGNYSTAEKYLDSIRNMSDFGYLIRLAKWNDHKGDLDTTIRLMEKARIKAENSGSKDLQLWAYTNLADYYGHAGRIKESYHQYLMALSLDPGNAYAKKGIAWIVFSYEKNAREAMRILDSVTRTYRAPDFYLLKSEIAEFMNDEHQRLYNLDSYFKAVQDAQYGTMYNMPNATLFIEQTGQYQRGLELAQQEVQNRPTPETFGLLAYAYMKMGQPDKALKIAEQQILGKTFEPQSLLYVAEIYKATGETEKLAELTADLLDATYELGPAMELRIKEL